MNTTLSIWDLGQANNTTACRKLLKHAQQQLKDLFFEQQADVNWLVKQQAHYVDEVLQFIWQHYLNAQSGLSLIAVGGYGRGELQPYSDIDLLILLDESIAHKPPEALSIFLTQLWDIGLEVGHSVRTLQECRSQAENDVSIATNLIEARYLSGEYALFENLTQLTTSNKTWDTQHFFERKRQEQVERHLRYNDSANNLEPNIKESPGGLRDIQVINWVAQEHFNVSDLEGLNEKGFLAQSEYETLFQALTFLRRVRFALHHAAARKQEKLLIDYQRILANQLGYQDSDKHLAVETFMKEYYRCARAVSQMNALLLQLFDENIILANEAKAIVPINRRFQTNNGYLETINAGIFAFYPYALLEIFLVLQQNPFIKGIRASTIRQIHAHLHLIDDTFRMDLKNRSLFMEIIRQPQGITHEFRRMNQLGVLGAYLPEFGQIVGQMQHDLFHAYTVDEHTLFLVGNLRRFSCEEFYNEFPLCSEVFQKIPKPELLYIAGIYHDIAKGRGGDHSELGVVDAQAFCQRHNISDHDTQLVCFLVRHHLAMSSTAQRKDIEDPKIIEEFANLIGNVTRLNYLYLLTVADIRATNLNLWNSWRDSLLKQLYQSTRQWLEHSEAQAKSIEEKSHSKYQQALQVLSQENWSVRQVTQLWKHYDLDYFLRHSVDEIVWQTTAQLEQSDDQLLVAVRPHNDAKHTLEIFIHCLDRHGLFATMTSVLEQLQLNILDARINTSESGETLNTFIVNGVRQHHQDIISAMKKRLSSTDLVVQYEPQLIPRTTRLFKTEPTLKFSTNVQQNRTVLELYTHDRPGLISAVAQVFFAHHIQLINAKLTTLGDQVEDVFFIVDEDNNALTEQAERALYKSLKNKLIEQADQQSPGNGYYI